MASAPTCRLVLLAVNADRSAVAVDGDALPTRERTLLPDEGALSAAWTDWDRFGLVGPMLDTVLDPTLGFAGSDVYASLIVVGPQPAEQPLPNGWTWRPLTLPDPDVHEGLREVVAQRLAEHRSRSAAPSSRPAWCAEEWHVRVHDWIREVLRSAGREAPTEIVQTKLWSISTIMRADAPDGSTWFKASFPYFGHEGQVTEALGRVASDLVPKVLGVERDEGWLLLDHVDGTVGETEVPRTAKPAEPITDLHARAATLVDELFEAGCPDRSIVELDTRLATGLRSELARSYVDVDETLCDRLTESVTDAVADVRSIGVPETIVHGDLHGGNVAMTDHGMVVFDWTDACRSHPAVDVVSWTEPFRNDADRVRSTWESFRDAWVDRFGVPWFEPDVRRLELVGQAFLFDSYVGIVGAIEPMRRRECARGIIDAFARLCELSRVVS